MMTSNDKSIEIKFHRNSIPKFLKHFNTIILDELKAIPDDSKQPAFAKTWQAWTKKGLLTAKSRSALCSIILARTTTPAKESLSQTLTLIVNTIRMKIPFLDDRFEFVKIDNDDIYRMIPKIETTDQSAPSTEQKKDEWQTPDSKMAFKQPKQANIPTATNPVKNPYSILTSKGTDSATSNKDDEGISFDSSTTKGTPPIKSTEEPVLLEF